MRRLLLVSALAIASCYRPDLGPPGESPFRCTDGRCPSRYHCLRQYCIADGSSLAPPIDIVETADDAAPQPVWDGERFTVFWQQNATGGDGLGPGLRQAWLEGDAFRRLAPLSPLTGDVAFTVLHHAATGLFVAAVRRNSELGATLWVASLAPGDDAPRQLLVRQEPTAAIGFSAPSLSVGAGDSVTLAYTLGAPPAIAANNVFCARIDLATGAASDACRPGLKQTMNLYATEATVVEMPGAQATFLFWRERYAYLTLRVGNLETTSALSGVLRVPHAVIASDKIGAVAQLPARLGGDRAPWVLSMGGFRRTGDTRSAFLTYDMVPDIVSDGTTFFTCSLDEEGELALGRYSAATLDSLGAATPVPRLSRAPITSCRLALSSKGEVAVTWQESVPPAFHSYLQIVKLQP